MGSSADIRLQAEQASADATPERTCVVTRACAPPADLIRFVADPDGNVVADINNKLPGRGVWVTCCHAKVAEAARRRLFARGLKREVFIMENLADQVDALLLRQAAQMCALANKAGVVTTGFAKVEGLILKGRCDVLVQANDAADDGRRKLANKHRAIAAELDRHAPIVDQLSIDELSLALGSSNVVHAGLSKGRVTNAFVQSAQRLGRYRAAAASNSDAAHDTFPVGGDAAGITKSTARKTGQA